MYKKLLAIDPSITCTGWALFSVANKTLLAAGKITPLSPKHHLADRLKNLNLQINDLYNQIKLSSKDILITEAPTTVIDPAALFKVEQVRTSFETLARERSTLVPGRINPRSVHYEVLGMSGRQLPRAEVKIMAVNAVDTLYKKELVKIGFDCEPSTYKKNQDVVDAILIGHLAVLRVESAQNTGTSIQNYLASLEQKKRGRGRRRA